jgi:hypothetical protein
MIWLEWLGLSAAVLVVFVVSCCISSPVRAARPNR